MPVGAARCDRRRDDVDLLAAEVAGFAACGFRPATRMRGRAMPKRSLQVAFEDAQRFDQAARA